MAAKVNYLNNRDLLKEIHLSKNSFCTFRDPVNDHQYDVIVESVADIPSSIPTAQQNRADRIKRATGEVLDPAAIPHSDLVFRVIEWEHIPFAPPKAPKAKKKKIAELFDFEEEPEDDEDFPPLDDVHIRLNFPPFYHYRLNESGEPFIVGKSHWKGTLEDGEFCRTHGSINNNLARMFLKLCERYATRSNWRGYCVDDQTEALTKRGWLDESKITTADEILSFNGNEMVWSPIRSIFRDVYNGKMFKMTSRGIDALMTPGHKIVTDKGLTKIEHLLESDRIVIMGKAPESPETAIYNDATVELAGWIVTEGNYQPNKQIVTIYQNEGRYADRIRTCLNTLGYEYSERKSPKSENISFSIRRKHWGEIVALLPNKNLTMEFLLSLTSAQKELLLSTMIDGDGHRDGLKMRYTQKNKEHMDMFQALCALTGRKANVKFVENKMSFGKPTSYYTATIFTERGNHTRGSSVDLHGGKNNGRKSPGQGKLTHPNFPTVDYTGTVWCPETDYGCFLARRNGMPYLTGNTYNEEMRGQALLQLAQVGLQFDEYKSQNPFAYYTTAIKNSFTRIVNLEKRNQNIRDDILEINGLNPSWSRQNSAAGGSHNYDYD